ncbi:glycosyltransferase family 2 protein [Schizophyllum commune Tattone D]|nr:glycosyltransferase family 2 protein [Schizophyllum commune Tattone D]
MPTIDKSNSRILVTGGAGFIGSHVAQRLVSEGFPFVRVVDIQDPVYDAATSLCHDFLKGDLRDVRVCDRAMKGITHVLHFAANMGGMGAIRAENDLIVYDDNHTITLNVLRAAIKAGATRILYASSACIYPEHLQADLSRDVRLREGDEWTNLTGPPKPQGLYGQEKLASEMLLAECEGKIEVRIARFHNVYGPRGEWYNGREKAPAAMLRKALVAARMQADSPSSKPSFEIWGDGRARRSFLYVDDCVDAVLKLLASNYSRPLNIGTEQAVTIQELAHIALEAAGVRPSDVDFRYDIAKPIGVASRNSHNELVHRVLHWEPRVDLRSGMLKTAEWMAGELDRLLAQGRALTSLQHSTLVHMEHNPITFAILLPITSRIAGGAHSTETVTANLTRFAHSLIRTTRGDRSADGHPPAFAFRVYVLADHDDSVLSDGRAARILADAGLSSADIVTLPPSYVARGRVCTLWRDCARRAYADACDYYILLGDDVELLSTGWMGSVHRAFADLSTTRQVPHGFGCVAFKDKTFAGMPTFPVVHRKHLDMFGGEVIPDIFINQDGDPYLYTIYRRFGCSRMLEDCRLRNDIGGSVDARYTKESASKWSFETLRVGVSRLRDELLKDNGGVVPQEKLSLDIVVPSYRVNIQALQAILSLRPSATCETSYIIIIDDPNAEGTQELLDKYSHRPEVRIRVHSTNLGASAARNRGMAESTADWVAFLDDDITPEPNFLLEAEKCIRNHPHAAGFVGHCKFPPADTVFKAAVHFAGVTYFWAIATQIDRDVPWGVTANLIARRADDGVLYDLVFPKTGGGEDIDFCLQKTTHSLAKGGEAFYAAPDAVVTHPWWHDGKRSYWRFYMWSVGDGALMRMYPQHSYRDYAPNAAESILTCTGLLLAGAALLRLDIVRFALTALPSVVLANLLLDVYRHLVLDDGSNIGNPSRQVELSGGYRALAVLESTFLRIFSEMGRTVGVLKRGEYAQLGMRFDWFVGRWGDGPKQNERKNNLLRFCIAGAFVGLGYFLF